MDDHSIYSEVGSYVTKSIDTTHSYVSTVSFITSAVLHIQNGLLATTTVDTKITEKNDEGQRNTDDQQVEQMVALFRLVGDADIGT